MGGVEEYWRQLFAKRKKEHMKKLLCSAVAVFCAFLLVLFGRKRRSDGPCDEPSRTARYAKKTAWAS
jgi:hypothetical protein